MMRALRNELPLGMIFIAALALRCIFLPGRSIQYDDAFSFFLAQQSLADIIQGTAADTMPPFYYFLLHFWSLLGRQLWWLRTLSVLFSLGGLLLLYAWVKDLAGRPAAGWAAFLAAISPLQIYHAQDLRMYTMLVFFQLGYAWCFTRIWLGGQEKRPVKGYWLGLVAFGAGAMYSHNLAVFVLAIPDLVLLFRRDWRLLGRLLLAQIAIGVLFLPWLVLLPGQIDKIQAAFWTPRPGLVELVQAVILFTTNLPVAQAWLPVAAVVSIEILAILALEVGRGVRRQKRLAYLAAWGLLPPALLFSVSYLMRPVFVPRGFLLAQMAYLGLAGWIIAERWKAVIGPLLAASFVAAAAIGLPYQLAFQEFPRSPFEAGGHFLQANLGSGDCVVHDNKLSYFPMHYYVPDLAMRFLADEPGSQNDTLAPATQDALRTWPEEGIQAAVNGCADVYFVTFTRTTAEYQALGSAGHPVIAWLAKHAQPLGMEKWNDLEIYRFHFEDRGGGGQT
ncbi:MAG: hypothetical protein GYA17_04940 [Chloroflexi bacterium]|nr:hypothetical protein [Chloroflexota bacterium]